MKTVADRMPSLLMAAGVVAGILMCAVGVPVWVIAIVGILAVAAIFARSKWAIATIGVAAGWTVMAVNVAAPLPDNLFDGRTRQFVATVCTGDVRTGGTMDLLFNHDGHKHRITALSNAGEGFLDGHSVKCTGRFVPLREVEDLPFAPAPDRAAKLRGCVARFEADDITATKDRDGNWAARCRARIEKWMLAVGIDDRSLGLYSAILLGDDALLDAGTHDSFRAAGVAHALALSGFHIGFIALLAGALLFPLRLWAGAYRLRLLGVLLLVWGYAVLTGFGASTVRACVMLTALVAVKSAGRRVSAWNGLWLAVAVILCLSPRQLFSVGFQLSVTAVAGILAFAPAMNPTRNGSFQLLTVPMAALLGTLTVTVFHFNQLPAYFLLSNIFIAAIFPLLMITGFGLVTAGALGIHGGAVATVADWLTALCDDVTTGISAWPVAQIDRLILSPFGVVAVGLVVAAGAVAVNFPLRKVVATCGVVMVAAVASAFVSSPKTESSELFVVPTGNGVGFVARFGDSVKVSLMSQPRFAEAAQRRVDRLIAPYMRNRECGNVKYENRDFDFGPYRRNGQFFCTAGTVTGIVAEGKRVDSICGGTDYVLVTNGCRADAERVLRRMSPDTLVLAPGLIPRKRHDFQSQAALHSIPIINMHNQSWAPAQKSSRTLRALHSQKET